MPANWKWIMAVVAAAALISPTVIFSGSSEVPSSVSLDTLSRLYDGVEYDHDLHLDVAEECSECHHHTLGTPVTDKSCIPCHRNSGMTESVRCGGCHAAQPFSAEYLLEKEEKIDLYHFDKPGLKAAYHLNCLQCHMEMGGPEGCQDCHTRNDTGDAFYFSGRYAPEGKLPGKGH